jgi:N utilization substance protein A
MRSLTDEARRIIALFEEETGAAVRDCVVDDEFDRVLVVVGTGEMGQAIGPGGDHVERVETRLDHGIKVVEYAPLAADFVANALSPAAVYNVTLSENDSTVAYAEVADQDRGVAIGADGRNIAAARTLADRLFDVADVELA